MKRKVIFSTIILLIAGLGIFAQPLVLDSIATTPVSCGGLSDGTISAYVSGGSGTGYNYELRQGIFSLENSGLIMSTNYTFAGYPKASNYYIIISDNNPFINPIFPFAAIGGPNPILVTSASSTDINCATFNDGTITVTASGEQGNYNFNLTGPFTDNNTTGFFELLPTGTYDVTVSDADGCPSTAVASGIFIDIPPLLTVVDDAIVPATCFGGSDGSISITASGGTPFVPAPDYTYVWTGPGIIDPALEDQTGLIAGDYQVTVTDANGCTVVSAIFTVGQATEIIMSVSSSSDVTCNGGSDGQAIISRSGGSPPYSYSWIGQSTAYTSSSRNPNNLVADIYDLTITDSKGCSKFFPSAVEIKEPDPITVTIDSKTDVSCFGGSDGSVQVTINGGTAPYIITSWTGPVPSGAEDPAGMSAGVYSLDVTDSNGCLQSFPSLVTIFEPEDITAVLNGSSDALCFGSADGTAQVTVAKGTPGYSYSWTGDISAYNSTAEDPVNLIADTYDLEITDANGCVKTFDNFVVIGEPSDITNTITVVDVLCNTAATGEISIDPVGGTPPYSFVWAGPGITLPNAKDQTGLVAGMYEVTVTDANLCSKVYSAIEVLENSAITATFLVSNLTCNNSGDGEIDATLSGGVGPYSYNWVSDLGYSNNIDEDPVLLDAANYTLTVTDAVGCVQAFPAQLVSEPDPLVAVFTGTDATCFNQDNGEISIDISGGTAPYTTDWTGPAFTSTDEDITGLAPGDYSLLLTDANGCSVNYLNEVNIDEPNDIAIIPSSTNITCNGEDDGTISVVANGGTSPYGFEWTGPGGYTSTLQNISGLKPGSYDLRITDAQGCIKDFPLVADIIEPSLITVTFDGQVDPVCFGENNGSIDISVSGGDPGYTFIWTNELGTQVSILEDPGNLVAGKYSLEVTDNSSCVVSYTDAITLTEPSELTMSLAKTDVVCYGQTSGTITVTAAGGTGIYEYRRLGFPYQFSNVFSGLGAGTYTIFTRDANMCETSDIINVAQPAQITYSDYGVSGSNTCAGDADATIYVNTINGGVPPFEYTIDGGANWQTQSSFPNLPGGSYDFRVRDKNLCERTINNNLVVDEPFPIVISFLNIDPVTTCYDTPEGKITLMASGGTGTLLYSINGGSTQLTGDFQNLLGGSYALQVVDDSLCTVDSIVEVLRPSKVIVDQADITDVTGCFGGTNGALDVNAIGGTGIKQFSLDATTYQASDLFTGLTAGDYTITARDVNLCTGDTTVTIDEPAPINLANESASDADCNGASTGSVSIEASGGTLPYTFPLLPAALPPQDSGNFVGLPAGDYTIEVTDAGGCGPATSNILTVGEPSTIVIDSIATEYISCSGANDAEIRIYASMGTPPYEYSIDNEVSYGSSSTFSGLSAGTYEVFVKDANGCSIYANSITFVNPSPITLNATLTHVTPCFGGANGAISATASGGWNQFEYSIDDITYSPSGDFANLTAQEYTIYAIDTGSCTSTITVNITEPQEVTATVTKTDYVDAVLGTITITSPEGGTPPYDYSIDGVGGTFTTTTSYTDLVTGTYEVVVRDALGCTYEETIVIYDILPLDIVIDSADVSCFGAADGFIEFLPQNAFGEVQYSIDGGATYLTSARFENLAGETKYILMAFDEEGKTFEDSVFLAEPEQMLVNSIPTAANCNAFSETGAINLTVSGGTGGYIFDWSNGAVSEDLTNVVAGNYTVVVTDNSGCEVSEDILIPAWIILIADAGEDTTICQGETIILNGKPGDVVMWEPATYLSNQGIPDPVASKVMGTITYVYTESETSSPFGCYNIDSLTITVLPTVGIDVTPDTTATEGQTIQLEATGGPFISYNWVPSTGLDASDVSDPVATAQSSIRYYVYGTNENGCVESDSVFIEVIENITVYNAFSPNNGDDINQYFEIENASQFPEIVVEVYNRWGTRMFSSVGYSDDKRWDGTFRGKDVPVGTYYYVIIPYPDATPITGNVTIIR